MAERHRSFDRAAPEKLTDGAGRLGSSARLADGARLPSSKVKPEAQQVVGHSGTLIGDHLTGIPRGTFRELGTGSATPTVRASWPPA